MWTSNAQKRGADIDRFPADSNPGIELWDRRKTAVVKLEGR